MPQLHSSKTLFVLAAALLASSFTLSAQQQPGSPLGPNQRGHLYAGERPTGYLPAGQIDFKQILPPFPVVGSPQDAADVTVLKQWQQPEGSPRLAQARADANMDYNQFSEAFGSKISPADSPILVHILDRVQADADAALGNAKSSFARPRPYQRFQFEHVCGFNEPPVPDNAAKGSSYPSGHTTYAWTSILALTQVAPDHAQPLLVRAREYAESRLVCAVHYPSDLLGGMILSANVLGRVSVQPEFQKELACAVEEHQIALKNRKQLTPACQTLADSLHKK